MCMSMCSGMVFRYVMLVAFAGNYGSTAVLKESFFRYQNCIQSKSGCAELYCGQQQLFLILLLL